jgi:glucosylceramidase
MQIRPSSPSFHASSLLLSVAALSLSLTGCGSSSSTGGGGSCGNTACPAQVQVATPTFSPAPGTFTASQTITISDTTSGATLYYTTDGTTPTTSSTKYTAPVSIATSATLKAMAAASGDTNSTVASGNYTIGVAGPPVAIVLTTHDQASLLAPQSSIAFNSGGLPIANQVQVDETQQYQTIEGFGAAFTDSACYLLEQVAQPSQLTTTMNDLFTRTGNGIGLSFMRNPMGASDLARSVYSFDDLASGSDIPLNNFSIAHDQTYIIPLIKAAQALNPQMKLMANPWSPPAWMKDTATMSGGSLNTADYTAFANYFVKYLQAYKTAGVTVNYITLQNEPLNNTTAYPSMYMDGPTELTVLRDYVLPALTTANLSTGVFVYDHNWDTPSYPQTVLSDPTILASSQVVGTAWHGYGGPPGAQQNIQNQFPTKGAWETEHSGGTFINDQFTSDFVEITLVLRNAAKSYVKWSLALDQTLGPNLGELNAGYGGCTTCTPIVTVNNSTGNITKDVEFYTLGQYSKFILPGAIRVWSSDTPNIVSSAFINPDGTRALVAFNNSTSSSTFQVQWGGQNFSYTLPADAAATFTWSGTQTGTANIPATQQIQGASYSSQSGLETEETGDATGSYDLGYTTNGAYAVYQNVDFGTSVSQVSVRFASDGGGGTVKFYLDNMTGTPIATATTPPTGGWQTWQTATAPVTAASGVHTLYAVFVGSNSTGIINMNWIQFQ